MKEGFSVIIPTYNEERIIAANARRLERFLGGLRTPYEIIIADNGSTDGTVKIAARLAEEFPKKVKLVRLPERGVGHAFRAAVKAARYEKLVSIDADLATDMGFVRKCVRLLETHSIVIGSKISGSQKRPLLRKALSGGFITMTRLLLGLNLTDYSIGAKGYRRRDVLRFVGDIGAGSFYVTALAYRILKSGKPLAEIPVMCEDTRPSKFNLAHEVLYRFYSLLAFWLREKLA